MPAFLFGHGLFFSLGGAVIADVADATTVVAAFVVSVDVAVTVAAVAATIGDAAFVANVAVNATN